MVYHGRDRAVLGEEQIKLLTLVDIFEPLSREEIEAIQWKHLNKRIYRTQRSWSWHRAGCHQDTPAGRARPSPGSSAIH